MNVKKQFAKYVSMNVFGMIGISLYILADSFFISLAQGADGLTALNLVLPIYNLIFALGAMVGVGSAIRFTVAKASANKDADTYLFNSLFFTGIIGAIFVAVGLVCPEQMLRILGANESILKVGVPYTRIFMAFSPMFMWNHVANAYVRNDGAPSVAMAATLCSSLFNIVFDYILMFPLKMEMEGAALATALSPVLGISICMTHILSKKSNIRIKVGRPSIKKLISSCQVGVSAFVGEMSSGVITMTFNFLILGIAGNVGVAAYGVVANTALVAIAVFNGIAQGSQPLISECYGRGQREEVIRLRNMSIITAFFMGIVIYAVIFGLTEPIVAAFNSEKSSELAAYAFKGVRLYFIGTLFAGINIVGSSFFSAIEKAKEAFVVSILRGFVLIIFFAFLLSALLKMTGIWLAYSAAEACTMIIFFVLVFLTNKRK